MYRVIKLLSIFLNCPVFLSLSYLRKASLHLQHIVFMLQLSNSDLQFLFWVTSSLRRSSFTSTVFQSGLTLSFEFLDPSIDLLVADIVLLRCLAVIASGSQAILYNLDPFLLLTLRPVFMRLPPDILCLKSLPLLYTLSHPLSVLGVRILYFLQISIKLPLPER